MMNIETKHAELSTMAVTIQALHVSGKQMTLAVFRQLPVSEEPEESELWGLVRYAIKDAGDIWVVFSCNGLLFRRELVVLANRELICERGVARRDHATCVADVNSWRTAQRPPWNKVAEAWEETRITNLKAAQQKLASAEEILRMMEEEVKRAEALIAREKHLLAVLPQLFIAV